MGFPRPDSTASVPAAPTRLLRTPGCVCPLTAPETGEQFSWGISLPELPLWTALPGFGVTVSPSPGKSQQFASPGTHEVQQIADCLLGLLNQKGICPIGPRYSLTSVAVGGDPRGGALAPITGNPRGIC